MLGQNCDQNLTKKSLNADEFPYLMSTYNQKKKSVAGPIL